MVFLYLDDNGTSQCLYPHYKLPAEFEGGVPVVADKKYILFTDIDYHLYSNSVEDLNRLFIIFSKKQMNKPAFSASLERDEDGYLFPKSLPSEEFQQWLNAYRSMGRECVEVEFISITITKEKE